MYRYVKKEEWDRLWNKEVLKVEDVDKADDWEAIVVEGNDAKYGRMMYSPSLDLIRKQTMMEFYGNSVVD